MRKTIIIILALAILLVGVPSVFAAGVKEAPADTFIDRFEIALRNSIFTEEEVAAILKSANDLSWEKAEGADAEVIVQALRIARDEQANLDAEENAELALALAQNAARLKNENYDEEVVAKTIREAVQNQLAVIKEWKASDKSEQLGELIRSGVSTEAQKATQEQKSGKPDDSHPAEDTPAEGAAENQPNGNNSSKADDSRP